MSEPAFLALYFDAPLQSWGYASKFDRRTSLSYPTRSGVIGLLCAALGIDRADTESLSQLDALSVHVYALRQGGRLMDYHTVGGGYDPKTQRMSISRRAAGGVGSTVQTRREYLESSRFGVIVAGDSETLSAIDNALRNPCWGMWLGRKACIPAARIPEGVFGSLEDALKRLCAVAEVDKPLRSITETVDFADGNDTLQDRPLDFAARQFAPRRVYVE